MSVRIDNASAAQRELLDEILAGLGDTRIERLTLAPRDLLDRNELGSLDYTPTLPEEEAARGTAAELSAPRDPSLRTIWEARLVANAFCELARERGLPSVVWFQENDGGSALGGSDIVMPREADPAEASELVSAAAGYSSAALEQLDVLCPGGPALACRLRIGEPHAFVRHELYDLLTNFAAAVGPLAGSYIEICDKATRPVYARACYVGAGSSGCMTSAREDIDCCNPLTTRTRFIDPPPGPRCPVFGDPLIA